MHEMSHVVAAVLCMTCCASCMHCPRKSNNSQSKSHALGESIIMPMSVARIVSGVLGITEP